MKAFLFILLSSIFILNANGVSAKTIYVRESNHHEAIQHAINVAQQGDTIVVGPGIYREHEIQINKTLYLKGIHYPTIDAEKKGTVISIQANGVVLEGFHIINSGAGEIRELAGIFIINSDRVTVQNNRLDNNTFSIYCQYSRNCTLKNNNITSHIKDEVLGGNGIHCWHSDSLLIIGNAIKGHRDGIYFEFVTHSLISGNLSQNNIRYGLHFMFSEGDKYIDNTFKDNHAGVAVMYTHDVQMIHNIFKDNWGGAAYGLLLKEISNSEISGNLFTRNTIAVQIESCTRLNLYKNRFIDNGYAIKISSSTIGSRVSHNNFMNNTFDVATNGSFIDNTFNGNYWDKYQGYDLNHDGVGDQPYHPVSMYGMIIESNPAALMLFRSLIADLLDETEKLLPGIIPKNLEDNKPYMKPLPL
jgi:nitrous oxidase accessory protein